MSETATIEYRIKPIVSCTASITMFLEHLLPFHRFDISNHVAKSVAKPR